MNTDEIIEMAKQAGFPTDWYDKRLLHNTEVLFFAKLVEDAAFKRWAAQTKLAVQDEREACARACEERGMVKGGEIFAARIRARGETTLRGEA